MLYSSGVRIVKKKISIFLSSSLNAGERKLHSTSVSAKKHLSVGWGTQDVPGGFYGKLKG
jgi:hypothetical protein